MTDHTDASSPSSRKRQQIGQRPELDVLTWALSISGLCQRPLFLTRPMFSSLAAGSASAPIICTMKGGGLPYQSVWSGVTLGQLIAMTDPLVSAAFVRLNAADGYSAVLPLELAQTALVAFERDGAPLSADDGGPARLILPEYTGYKQVKWLVRVDLQAEADGGFWETRGYPLLQPISPGCIFTTVPELTGTVGQPLRFEGLAWGDSATGPTIGISVDWGGWMPLRLAQAETRIQAWSISWTAPHPGTYFVRVAPQPADETDQRDSARWMRRRQAIMVVINA